MLLCQFNLGAYVLRTALLEWRVLGRGHVLSTLAVKLHDGASSCLHLGSDLQLLRDVSCIEITYTGPCLENRLQGAMLV